MTNEEFDTLVFKLEDQARREPKKYQAKVFMLGLLGNFYLGAILLLLLAILGGLIALITVLKFLAVKGLLIGGAFFWLLLKALWVKVPAPEGKKITPADAPELFAMLKELGEKLDAPQFHQVLLIDEFNAAVVQSPQLGIFGYYKNYLLIGLPLMKSLTKEQFKAVLAHEFGHLAKGHGRASNWIYRQRLRWSRLIGTLLANRSTGSFLFTPFFNWYAPYFSAYSFPLARANEYEADAAAARLTSKQAAAQALTNVSVVGCYLNERYWPGIHKQVSSLAAPNFLPYSAMNDGLSSDLDESSSQSWMNQALSRKTTSGDTHPALADRLEAMGANAEFSPPTSDQAADQLLGKALDAITMEFDLRWQDNIGHAWQERHQEIQKERLRLVELNTKLTGAIELNLEEQYERAFLTASIEENQASALEQFRAIHAANQDSAKACFCLGIRLLENDSDEGIAIMEHCIQLDREFTFHASMALRDYYARSQNDNLATKWHKRLIASVPG